MLMVPQLAEARGPLQVTPAGDPGKWRVVFVGNCRCYHTMDWYRIVKRQMPEGEVVIATDLINSEGHKVLVSREDQVVRLFNIDSFLLPTQSRLGSLWRNAIKLAFLPIQAVKLRRLARDHRNAVFHAHTMYYMVLCMWAGVKCIGTPQGSEILVRPWRSRLYKHVAVRALRWAESVTVDSIAMRDQIKEMSGIRADVIQNGIDVRTLSRLAHEARNRDVIVSIRGMTPLYRIGEILRARERAELAAPMTFIYPYWDENYRAAVRQLIRGEDRDLGRLDKADMYPLLARALMVVSVPESDSSPRSVYEAIFAGATVAATPGAWVDALPKCMRKRVVMVDLADKEWFGRALSEARRMSREPYLPSEAAYELFDEERSMSRVIERYYSSAA